MVQNRNTINFKWLLRLRWGMIAGEFLAIWGGHQFLSVELPLVLLFSVLAASAMTNLIAQLASQKAKSISTHWTGSIMVLDSFTLTLLLYFSGGPSNPFNFLYLVQITLAAIMLSIAWTWALTALALFSFGSLFIGSHTAMHGMGMHLYGMWVAFGVAALFIVYFVHRVTRDLSKQEQELALLRRKESQTEKLTALATLSAGAAHELSTPLSTIAVVAKELERRLAKNKSDAAESIDDARLIREEVTRCHEILRQMSASAGEVSGESFSDAEIGSLLKAALEPLEERNRVVLNVKNQAILPKVPAQALQGALRALIKNALEASSDESVTVTVPTNPGPFFVRIEDKGQGMTPDELSRIGEPFFTTKPVGKGMGLGVFLSRSVIERVGGSLTFESQVGSGTTAVIQLPTTNHA